MSEPEPSRLHMPSGMGGALPPLSLPPLSLPPMKTDHYGLSPLGMSYSSYTPSLHSPNIASPSNHIASPQTPIMMAQSPGSPLASTNGGTRQAPVKRRLNNLGKVMPHFQHPLPPQDRLLENQHIEPPLKQLKNVPGSPGTMQAGPSTPSSLQMRFNMEGSPGTSMSTSPLAMSSQPSTSQISNGNGYSGSYHQNNHLGGHHVQPIMHQSPQSMHLSPQPMGVPLPSMAMSMANNRHQEYREQQGPGVSNGTLLAPAMSGPSTSNAYPRQRMLPPEQQAYHRSQIQQPYNVRKQEQQSMLQPMNSPQQNSPQLQQSVPQSPVQQSVPSSPIQGPSTPTMLPPLGISSQPSTSQLPPTQRSADKSLPQVQLKIEPSPQMRLETEQNNLITPAQLQTLRYEQKRLKLTQKIVLDALNVPKEESNQNVSPRMDPPQVSVSPLATLQQAAPKIESSQSQIAKPAPSTPQPRQEEKPFIQQIQQTVQQLEPNRKQNIRPTQPQIQGQSKQEPTLKTQLIEAEAKPVIIKQNDAKSPEEPKKMQPIAMVGKAVNGQKVQVKKDTPLPANFQQQKVPYGPKGQIQTVIVNKTQNNMQQRTLAPVHQVIAQQRLAPLAQLVQVQKPAPGIQAPPSTPVSGVPPPKLAAPSQPAKDFSMSQAQIKQIISERLKHPALPQHQMQGPTVQQALMARNLQQQHRLIPTQLIPGQLHPSQANLPVRTVIQAHQQQLAAAANGRPGIGPVMLNPQMAQGIGVMMGGPPRREHTISINMAKMLDERASQNLSSKEQYRLFKKKFKYLVYENECYQEELRHLQRKLLKLTRDKNFLLDRLINYEKLSDESDDDSDSSQKTVEERPKTKRRSRPSRSRKEALAIATRSTSGTPSPCPSPAPGSNLLTRMLQSSNQKMEDDRVSIDDDTESITDDLDQDPDVLPPDDQDDLDEDIDMDQEMEEPQPSTSSEEPKIKEEEKPFAEKRRSPREKEGRIKVRLADIPREYLTAGPSSAVLPPLPIHSTESGSTESTDDGMDEDSQDSQDYEESPSSSRPPSAPPTRSSSRLNGVLPTSSFLPTKQEPTTSSNDKPV